jgi:hypothetical protein
MDMLPYTPASVDLAILTVSREPQYIHQTLASLFAADPALHGLDKVWIMVGSNDATYLRRYLHHRKLRIQPLSVKEYEQVRDWQIHRKFNHNYHRCLTVPMTGKRGVIVCEDDIVVRDDFLTRTLDTIREMELEHGLRQYALALYSGWDFENDASFYRGKRFCSYGFAFYGTQCIYYPKACAAEVADFIYKHGVEVCEAPGDMLIKRFYGDKMYSSPRALAQHVGEVSTGLGGSAGCASFDRPYRLIPRAEWGQKS